MRNWFKTNRSQMGLTVLVLGVLLLMIVMVLTATPVMAAPQPQGDQPTDETCLTYHQQEGMTAQVGGQPLPITIDPEKILPPFKGVKHIFC
jgi:hypothetical protein